MWQKLCFLAVTHRNIASKETLLSCLLYNILVRSDRSVNLSEEGECSCWFSFVPIRIIEYQYQDVAWMYPCGSVSKWQSSPKEGSLAALIVPAASQGQDLCCPMPMHITHSSPGRICTEQLGRSRLKALKNTIAWQLIENSIISHITLKNMTRGENNSWDNYYPKMFPITNRSTAWAPGLFIPRADYNIMIWVIQWLIQYQDQYLPLYFFSIV